MSTVQGGQGNVITSGLVLYFDAANPRSYLPPYNGTTWFNIASSSFSGSLLNGPTYNTSNGGFLAFDGTDDDCRFNYTGLDTGNFTYCTWVKTSSTEVNEFMVRGRDGFGNGWSIALAYIPATKTFNNAVVESGVQYNLTTTTTVEYNTWVFLTGIRAHGVGTSLYINGVFNTSRTVNGTLRNSTLGWNIGNEGSGPYVSNTATYMVYDRILNASEINQNFQATRARFGI